MCCRRLLLLALVGIYLTTASAIQCYAGVENQCILAPDIADCGSNDTCVCARFRFECTATIPGCSQQEQDSKVKKWVYTVIGGHTCKFMEGWSSYFEGISCCSTDGCNKPVSGTCAQLPSFRRSLRKLENRFHFRSRAMKHHH